MAGALDERIAATRKRIYAELRAHDVGLYRRCIEGAQCVILNHRLTGPAAVDCEWAVVAAAHDALRRRYGQGEQK